MKLKTFLGLLSSGQLALLLRAGPVMQHYYRSTFVAAALSEGLYTLLRNRPASLDQIYQHLIGTSSAEDISRDKLKTWLDLGVTFGELKATPNGYAIRSRLSRQLADPSNDAVAALFEEVCILHHTLITETPARLREKRFFTFGDANGELIARSSRILEPYIFEFVDSVIPEKGACRLLEVGCGSGVYIQRACHRNPDLQAVGLELQPIVADFARQNLRDWGFADRVRVDTGDIRTYENPERFDLVTLHNNIYYFPVPERLDLIHRLGDFLVPGGKLLATTGCRGNPSTDVLNLWGIMTEGAGPLPEPDDLCDLMSQAGFLSARKTELVPRSGFFGYIGIKG